jgi:hypothetical protein
MITLSSIHQQSPNNEPLRAKYLPIDVLLIKESFPQSLGQQFRALTAEKG